MVLPAVSDAETLDLISKLYGTYEVPSRDHHEEQRR
jgi:hypothetical protein